MGLIISIIPVSASNETKEQTIINNQIIATKQNNKILNFFESQSPARSADDLEKTKLNYPNYYGGSYLDEKGELVVLIKKNSNSTDVTTLLKNVSDNNKLKFNYVNYSYSELSQMIEYIMNYKDNNDNAVAENISACSLNDKENYIEVYLKNCSSISTSNFKNQVLNNSALYFKDASNTDFSYSNSETTEKNSNNTSSSTTYVRPGNGINGSNGRTYSIGFPVYRDISSGREYGFVTSSHFLNVGNTIKFASTDTTIGTVRLTRIGGPYDVSFVSLNSNVSCLNTITQTSYSLPQSNEEIDYPIVGKYVYLNGRVHSNSGGTINSTNFSLSTSLATHNGLVKASYNGSDGDSGGLVSSSGANTNSRIQEGIHMGVYQSQGVFCSAYNIVNLWYLTCY